jgi:serine O-acetyltransferase
VVVYPNSAIIGRCDVGDGAVISQGTSVLDAGVPPNRLAFAGADGRLAFRPAPTAILEEYFRA